MQPRFDFAAFYQNDNLSDCSLLIRIDGDVKQRLPGHGIVLSNGGQLPQLTQQLCALVPRNRCQGLQSGTLLPRQHAAMYKFCCDVDFCGGCCTVLLSPQ